jgi:hypothetical protein
MTALVVQATQASAWLPHPLATRKHCSSCLRQRCRTSKIDRTIWVMDETPPINVSHHVTIAGSSVDAGLELEDVQQALHHEAAMEWTLAEPRQPHALRCCAGTIVSEGSASDKWDRIGSCSHSTPHARSAPSSHLPPPLLPCPLSLGLHRNDTRSHASRTRFERVQPVPTTSVAHRTRTHALGATTPRVS